MQVAATDDDEHSHATTLFRSMAHTGRPLKCKKNISGLRNQSQKSINTPNDALAGWQRSESPRSNSDSESEALDDACWQAPTDHNSLKLLPSRLDLDASSDSDAEEESDWEEVADEEFLEEMLRLGENEGDDAQDEDWVPERQCCRRKVAKCSTDLPVRPKGVLCNYL